MSSAEEFARYLNPGPEVQRAIENANRERARVQAAKNIGYRVTQTLLYLTPRRCYWPGLIALFFLGAIMLIGAMQVTSVVLQAHFLVPAQKTPAITFAANETHFVFHVYNKTDALDIKKLTDDGKRIVFVDIETFQSRVYGLMLDAGHQINFTTFVQTALAYGEFVRLEMKDGKLAASVEKRAESVKLYITGSSSSSNASEIVVQTNATVETFFYQEEGTDKEVRDENKLLKRAVIMSLLFALLCLAAAVMLMLSRREASSSFAEAEPPAEAVEVRTRKSARNTQKQ
jgi:hypothetical protein